MDNSKIKGVDHEIEFWRSFVKTDRFLHGWVKEIQTPELRPQIADFIKANLPKGGKVLDCASGVVSILNGLVPKSRLTACDLLGKEYESLFDYKAHKIKPPLPIACEELPYNEEFDLVHCSNGLDHCQDVSKSYDKLLQAVKPGGYLIVAGFENEGTFEKWQGLHKTNLSINKDALLIGDKYGYYTAYVGDNTVMAETFTLETGKRFFIWIVKA